MPRERYPDCEHCEAPCCRRQFMEDSSGWFTLADARPIYLEAGTDIKIVGWHQQKDGRQPQFECQAFDKKALRCTVYESRPEHCRTYDCREDDCLVRLRLFGRGRGAGRGLVGVVRLFAERPHALAQLTENVRELPRSEHDEHDHQNEDELRAP